MLPIVVIFFLFQFFLLKLPRRSLCKILIGLLYTYAGLVLFLTGVNIGFSTLGAELGADRRKDLLVPHSARPAARLVHYFRRTRRCRPGNTD